MTILEKKIRENFFSNQEKGLLAKDKIPKHIAITPDGNRRWARQNGINPLLGHQKGAENVIDIVLAAKELGVKHLTFYAFSTENMLRPKQEVDAVMAILACLLIREMPSMIEEGIRFSTIGDLTPISKEVLEAIDEAKEGTASGEFIDFTLAINYGGRDELCRAVDQIVKKAKLGFLEGSINEEILQRHLDTSHLPDPELLIRSGGEKRVSNFLIWQASYSELYTSEVLWPDFRSNDLYQAVLTYQSRKRRLGI